jgi:hypothetical protein
MSATIWTALVGSRAFDRYGGHVASTPDSANRAEDSDELAAASAPSALSISAFVLSFLVPIAGLITSLISRASARRERRQVDGLTTAALVISSVFTGVGIVGGVGLLAFVLAVGNQVATVTSAVAPSSAPVAVNDVVTTVADTQGAVQNGDSFDAAKAVARHRLERAGVKFSHFAANSQGQLVTTFADGASANTLRSAASTIAAPTDGSFRKVLGSGDPAAGGSAVYSSSPLLTQSIANKFSKASCKSVVSSLSGAITLSNGFLVACSSDLKTKYLLGGVEVPGEDISSYTVAGADVTIQLNSSGAHQWANLSSGLISATAPDNQVALVAGNEVVLASTIVSVVTDGQIAFTSESVGALVANQLALVAHGVSLSTAAIHTKQ